MLSFFRTSARLVHLDADLVVTTCESPGVDDVVTEMDPLLTSTLCLVADDTGDQLCR